MNISATVGAMEDTLRANRYDGIPIYATVLSTASYVPGLDLLSTSLRASGATSPLLVLTTLTSIPEEESLSRCLNIIFARVPHIVNPYRQREPRSMSRFAYTMDKLWAFAVPTSRLLLIDLDVFVRSSPEALLHRSMPAWLPLLAASELCGFNTGVMLLQPWGGSGGAWGFGGKKQ